MTSMTVRMHHDGVERGPTTGPPCSIDLSELGTPGVALLTALDMVCAMSGLMKRQACPGTRKTCLEAYEANVPGRRKRLLAQRNLYLQKLAATPQLGPWSWQQGAGPLLQHIVEAQFLLCEPSAAIMTVVGGCNQCSQLPAAVHMLDETDQIGYIIICGAVGCCRWSNPTTSQKGHEVIKSFWKVTLSKEICVLVWPRCKLS